ncbi:phosphoribosyltransferase family protein [uncultured Limosilactobacillus sp.]|uniref:ComF family protein n=1 Tax=uncultured Limosilactobacillus sp. TaxID=2837629 RepID=UPI0025E886EB|nr:phosphoribosyltransferase family protein [uncultured Limosilactobacillus sp.]
MKDYMHRYKFQGDYLLRLVFSEIMTAQVKQVAADLVVPIPVSQSTWLSRGFNQVAGLVECPLANLLVVRKRQKRPQSSRSRQERLAIQQPFGWFSEEARQKVNGQRVLLVDDVYTTGRTMYYGASLLRQAGAKSVKSLSLAG